MPLSNPFRRTADRPSLRERAAALRASFSPTTVAPVALPAPGSEEAMAAFHAACHQDTIRSQGIIDGYPELKRSPLGWWTADSLAKAMETGEITPAECARLFPHATERELRMAEIHHDLNLGALHALAFANSYPVPTGPDADEGRDADLLVLGPAWKEAAALYSQRIEELGETEGASAARDVVEDVERAVRVAGDALHALEAQIGEYPALTIAGLRLKARVAKRCDSAEIVWPDGFGEGLARDILAMSEPEVEADADLLRIGRLFEAARDREMEACEACNAATKEARNHMPERPAALLYRASDHALYLHKHYTSPEYLDGREITSDDVEWVSRKRHTRDVRRPVRPEDKLPADAQFVVRCEPWPEAQSRADEIVAAWKAWHAERNAVYAAHGLPRLEETADKAGDATAALAERLAAIPARTADGFRLKLRALAFYRHSVLEPELEDVSDPDQILSHSLWRDVQSKMPAAFDAEAAPATASIIPFGPDAHIAELAAEFCEAYARNIRADRASMAGQITEAEWLPHYEAAKALMEQLEATEPKTMLGMALKCLGPIGAAGYNAPADSSEAQTDAWERAGAQFADAVLAGTLAPLASLGPTPVNLLAAAGLNLSRLSLRDVAALHDITSTLVRVVRAMQCQPRSWAGPFLNDVGKFTDWLGDQFDAQVDATVRELRGREPADWIERDIRLEAIAEATIANGDMAQTVAFAREVLDYATQHEAEMPADPVLALIAESHRAEEAASGWHAARGKTTEPDASDHEAVLFEHQDAARSAVLSTMPTTREGLKAFADFVGFQASLTYGSDWRAKVSQEMGGDLLVALCAAVETAADA